VVRKILQNLMAEMMIDVQVAEISAAMHQDRSAADRLLEPGRVIALHRAFIRHIDAEALQQDLFAEPDRVVSRIGGVGKINQYERATSIENRSKRRDDGLAQTPDGLEVLHCAVRLAPVFESRARLSYREA